MEAVIRGVYYNADTGFGSVKKTLQQVRAIDPSITEEDVRRFLAKQKVKQDLTRKRREGSYVASAPREEFQADLADFGERASPRYGLACIDVFSRLATIIPLPEKSSVAVRNALDKILQEMGYPVRLVTDLGAEFDNDTVASDLKERGIEHVTLQSYPNFAERFIRTVRTMIFARSPANWTDVLAPVLKLYNSEEHSKTQMAPKIAAMDVNTTIVRNRLNRNLKIVKRPELNIGDIVRIAKPHTTSRRVNTVQWEEDAHQVEDISFSGGIKRYLVDGKLYLRHDLLKIEDVQMEGGSVIERPRDLEKAENRFQRQEGRRRDLASVVIPSRNIPRPHPAAGVGLDPPTPPIGPSRRRRLLQATPIGPSPRRRHLVARARALEAQMHPADFADVVRGMRERRRVPLPLPDPPDSDDDEPMPQAEEPRPPPPDSDDGSDSDDEPLVRPPPAAPRPPQPDPDLAPLVQPAVRRPVPRYNPDNTRRWELVAFLAGRTGEPRANFSKRFFPSRRDLLAEINRRNIMPMI